MDTILKASEKSAGQRLSAENNYSNYKGFTRSSSGTNDRSTSILRKSETERKRRTEKKSQREIIAMHKKKIDAKFPVRYWFIGLMLCWVIVVEKKKKEKKQKKNLTELLIILYCSCLVFKIITLKN